MFQPAARAGSTARRPSWRFAPRPCTWMTQRRRRFRRRDEPGRRRPEWRLDDDVLVRVTRAPTGRGGTSRRSDRGRHARAVRSRPTRCVGARPGRRRRSTSPSRAWPGIVVEPEPVSPAHPRLVGVPRARSPRPREVDRDDAHVLLAPVVGRGDDSTRHPTVSTSRPLPRPRRRGEQRRAPRLRSRSGRSLPVASTHPCSLPRSRRPCAAAVRRAADIRSIRDSSLHSCPTPRRITPAEFEAALDARACGLAARGAAHLGDPAPGSLAPFAVALSADVAPTRHGDDSELGTGRFVLLYDPTSPRPGAAASAWSASRRHRSRPTSDSTRSSRMSRGRGSSTRSTRAVRGTSRHPAPRRRSSRPASVSSPARATAPRSSCAPRGRPSTPRSARMWKAGVSCCACSRGCRLAQKG